MKTKLTPQDINDVIVDEKIGKDIARADAVRQIWELEGYLLKTALSEIE